MGNPLNHQADKKYTYFENNSIFIGFYDKTIQVKADWNECSMSGGTVPSAFIPYYVYYCDSSKPVTSVRITALSAKGIDLCEVEAYGERLNN
jgi:hypothetical protein